MGLELCEGKTVELRVAEHGAVGGDDRETHARGLGEAVCNPLRSLDRHFAVDLRQNRGHGAGHGLQLLLGLLLQVLRQLTLQPDPRGTAPPEDEDDRDDEELRPDAEFQTTARSPTGGSSANR